MEMSVRLWISSMTRTKQTAWYSQKGLGLMASSSWIRTRISITCVEPPAIESLRVGFQWSPRRCSTLPHTLYHLVSSKADIPNTGFKKANGNTAADVLLWNTSHLCATDRARQVVATNDASFRTILQSCLLRLLQDFCRKCLRTRRKDSSMTLMQHSSHRSSGCRPFTQSCCVLLADTKRLGNIKSKDRPLGL